MNPNYYAMILAGGKGERFWPLSTSRRPKQLLTLAGGRPMLAQAVERLDGLIPPERVFIITSADLAGACREVAPSLPPANVVEEPFGRDTAAAIALGAALVRQRNSGASFCVLTADHVIGDVPVFARTLQSCLDLAAGKDALITLGIKPRFPSTGYGYIEAGAPCTRLGEEEFRSVLRFVEKPDIETATRYCDSGRFFWNSGMFVWSLTSFEAALKKHRTALWAMMERVAGPETGLEARIEGEYRKLEKISIDYALMEKADNIVVCPGTFAWDDVGSWPALEEHLPRDGAGNAVMGECIALDSGSNIVVSDNRLTALIGVNDLIVVQAEGVTLVCAREKAQEVKKMVERLKAEGRHPELL